MTFGILALRIWSLCRFWVPAIFLHSLGQSLGPLGVHSVTCCKDLGSLQVLGPCSAGSGGSGVSGAQCHLLLDSAGSGSYLYAFLRAVSGALGGPQCHLLQGSGVSAGSGSLLCRIWRIWSLWGPVSLAALFLPIFMHSLGDVWHLGSEDLESLQVLGPCYLYAFLR